MVPWEILFLVSLPFFLLTGPEIQKSLAMLSLNTCFVISLIESRRYHFRFLNYLEANGFLYNELDVSNRLMTFLGLELNVGLTASLALAILAVFWNYSSLPEVRWTEVTAGLMAFLAGAGVQLLNGSAALQMFYSNQWVSYVTAVLYVVGGLLVLIGGVVNGVQLLNERYA